MFKGLSFTENAKKIIAGGMVALCLTTLPACGAMQDSNLTNRVVRLSEAEDTDILIDDYLKSICESKETSIKEMERGLEDAYLDGDRTACNTQLTNILKAELKALTAEGLGIDEKEMEDFCVTGYYVRAPFLSDLDKEESYGIYFRYHGHEYNIKANDSDAVKACFYVRAGQKNQISLDDNGDTIVTYKNGYQLCKDLLGKKFVFKEKTISETIIGATDLELTNQVIYIGEFNLDKDKEKVRAMK